MTNSVEEHTGPELKGFDCTDYDPIQDHDFKDDAVSFWLTLHLGERNREGADYYQVHVMTHEGMRQSKQDGQKIGPKPPILLDTYSWGAVMVEVQNRLYQCDGFGWRDVQEKLCIHFYWEYENLK